ncbi:hypothetical protein TNCV_1260081 [Trichonephila clavipes]|nr:hypothetical protein TNCV_1260081 [Trichonephila clavipes]
MVSPAVQGQVRHPSIVPEFLRSNSCGMTSERGHGVIVYCLNSGSEDRQTGCHNSKCCVKGIQRTGGVMDKCVQMLDKELWRILGQQLRVCFGLLCANRTREKRTKKVGREQTRGEDRRDGERKGLSPGLEFKDDERRCR